MTNKERLKELKEWFNNDKEIHEFQIEWLIAQAEKVERYERAFDLVLKNSISGHIDNIIKKAREGNF